MINDQIRIPINGVRQYISIRSEQERAPLLLYLHGGPGDTALPLVLKYNRELECSFTVAVWEQRGAGKSYYPFRPDETITIDTFLRYDPITNTIQFFLQVGVQRGSNFLGRVQRAKIR